MSHWEDLTSINIVADQYLYFECIYYMETPQKIKYIGLGSNCCVKYQIEKYKGKDETNFFDRVISDIKSVNTVLSYYNRIDELICRDNIIIKESVSYNTHIDIKSLALFHSIHDVPRSYTEDDIDEFINKYKRRLQRLFDHILSTDYVIFIRYDSNICSFESDKFINMVKDINSSCKFMLVHIKYKSPHNSVNRVNKYYLEINISKVASENVEDWTRSYLDWAQIFSHIDEAAIE